MIPASGGRAREGVAVPAAVRDHHFDVLLIHREHSVLAIARVQWTRQLHRRHAGHLDVRSTK
eukprot:9387379-Pyramimonas_sp.AAC.1